MSVKSKMKAIADPIRELAGTTQALTLDGMAAQAGNAVNTVSDQADLLDRAIELLEGKTAGDGTAEPILQQKSVVPTQSTQAVTADKGYDGLSKVTVDAIPPEYVIPEGEKAITANGTHDVTEYASVSVNVPGEEPVLQEKTVTPTTSSQSVMPDSGYDGLSKVTVDAIPPEYVIPEGEKAITSNGTHNVTEYASVSVNVPGEEPVLQEKTVTPTTSSQSVMPDSGYDGLSKVTVHPIPSAYIIPSGQKAITANGTHNVTEYASVSVNVPGEEPVLQEKTVTPTTSSQSVMPDSGYDGLSKVTVNAMPTAAQAAPSISVSAGGLITASATQSAGYVASGTRSATKQLPVESWQITLENGTVVEKVVVLE